MAQLLPTSDSASRIRELVAVVQNEAKASVQPGIPARLVAGVEALSHCLEDERSLEAVLKADEQLAADVQKIYCKGSLVTCFCSHEAVTHWPAAAAVYFSGMEAVLGSIDTRSADSEAIFAAAGPIDSTLACEQQCRDLRAGIGCRWSIQTRSGRTASPSGTVLQVLAARSVSQAGRSVCNSGKAIERVELTCSTTTSQADLQAPTCPQLRSSYLYMVTTCIAAAEAQGRTWELASPAVEPMLHLALGELSQACHQALGQPDGLERPPKSSTKQAQQPLHQRLQGRADIGVMLLYKLLPLAEEAADRGRLGMDRLMQCAPCFMQYLTLYAGQAGQLASSQLGMLRWGACGLTTVLQLQQRALLHLAALRPSPPHTAALSSALDQRMQWIAAAAAFAKALHVLLDANAGTSHVEDAQAATKKGTAVKHCRDGLFSSLHLADMLLPSHCGVEHPGLNACVGGFPAFSKLPGAVPPLLELAELLLRVVPKLRAFVKKDTAGPEVAVEQHRETTWYLVKQAAWLTGEVLWEFESVQASPTRQSQRWPGHPGSVTSSTSRCSTVIRGERDVAATADAPVQRLASLAGTAAKLSRCLPAWETLAPNDVRPRLASHSLQLALVLEDLATLCSGALALDPSLVAPPSPQRSLTMHLQRTGFLTFVCLPALAQAHECLHPNDWQKLMGRRRISRTVSDLLAQLRRLHLINDAVRGGGLGPFLRHCLQSVLAPRHFADAASLLLQLCMDLDAEHAEVLAVALVKGGLLQAAAEYSRRLSGKKTPKFRDTQVAQLSFGALPSSNTACVTTLLVAGYNFMLPVHTAMLFHAVCSVLDREASTGLLDTFSALLEGVPSIADCSSSVRDTDAASDRSAFGIPPGPWCVRFSSTQAWDQVRSELLPALTAACEGFTPDSRLQQQDGIFRDVAVSAWTCGNPGCTNMAGQQEASLALSKCVGCGEARYCSRACQRQDWRRHKPICQAIREL